MKRLPLCCSWGRGISFQIESKSITIMPGTDLHYHTKQSISEGDRKSGTVFGPRGETKGGLALADEGCCFVVTGDVGCCSKWLQDCKKNFEGLCLVGSG